MLIESAFRDSYILTSKQIKRLGIIITWESGLNIWTDIVGNEITIEYLDNLKISSICAVVC